MLLERVAIEPDILTSEDLINILHYKFKWSNGRFVAEIPQNWLDRARLVSKSLPDGLKKKRLDAILDIHGLPRTNLNMRAHKNDVWEDLVSKAKNNHKITAVLCSNPKDADGWFGEEQIDNYLIASDERIGSIDIKGMSPLSIVDSIDDFLQANKRIVLVNPDQWLLTQRHESKELFKCLFNRWKDYGGWSFKVIRSKRGKRIDEVKEKWSADTQELGRFLSSVGYKKDFIFVAVDDSIDRLHDRYLIGNWFGLKLGYGLETSPQKSHPWTLMQQSEHKVQAKRFLTEDVRDAYDDFMTWQFRPK
jgi:hypothetical protein